PRSGYLPHVPTRASPSLRFASARLRHSVDSMVRGRGRSRRTAGTGASAAAHSPRTLSGAGSFGRQQRPPAAAKTERQTSRAVRRVLFPGVLADPGATAIHLGPVLPPASCGLPADSGGQPSSVRAEAPGCFLLTLLRVGFT